MLRGKVDALGSPINVFLEIGIHLPSFATTSVGVFQHPLAFTQPIESGEVGSDKELFTTVTIIYVVGEEI